MQGTNALVANTYANMDAIHPSAPQPQHGQTQMNPEMQVTHNDQQLPMPQLATAAQPITGASFFRPSPQGLAHGDLAQYDQPQQAHPGMDPTPYIQADTHDRQEEIRQEQAEEIAENTGVKRPTDDEGDFDPK